jgi:hypothetical protein
MVGFWSECNLQTEKNMLPNKEPRQGGVLRIDGLSDEVLLCGNVGRLEALRTFFYFKCDRLTFAQSFETRALNRIEMYKDILTTVRRGNKTKTFGFVKPLYCTCSHITFTLKIN